MNETLSALEILVKIIAVVVGGFWAYYRFFRGRIFHPRIFLSVSGSIFNKDSKSYVNAVVNIENKGNTAVHIDHDNTFILVYNEHGLPGYGHLIDIIKIISDCDIVEPQESVKDEQVSRLDTVPDVALKLVFNVQSKPYWTWRGIRISYWTSSALVLEQNK